MNRNTLLTGMVSITLCTLIFSTMEVVLKLLSLEGSIHPMQITVDRFLVGGLCLIPFAALSLKRKGLRVQREHLRGFALTGLLCVPLSMVLFQMAVHYGQANVIAVLFSGNPVFVTILAFLILHERIYWNNVLALVLSVLGILAIVDPWGKTEVNLLSVVLLLLAALLFSLYSVFGKRLTKVYGGIAVTCLTFLFGGLQLLFLLLLGRISVVAGFYETVGLSIFVDVPFLAGINRATLPYILYICLVNSAGGYVFHMLAMEKLGPHPTNLIFFFKPILAPLFALAFLAEPITENIVLGIVFFLLGSLSGIVPALLRTRRQAKETTKPPCGS